MRPQIPLAILIIDDEPAFTMGLARLLRRDGHAVETAGNGQVALEKLQERPYDLLLCDLRMPTLDGPAFYDTLQRQYSHLGRRVIFITGDALSITSLTFLEQHGLLWLQKPFTASRIRQVIQQVSQL